jgi:RNA ligase (TIGR02306 family)
MSTKRKLASVQVIWDVSPIEGADRIEVVSVLGWKCVAKKGEFSRGDRCVYFEIDSFLPVDERFEFLRSSSYRKSDLMGEGFRLRTQKMRGQISQGLVLPLSILPAGEYATGQNVTEILGVRKWEVEERATDGGTIIGDLPGAIPKTEETRVQAEPGLIDELAGMPYYITTKLDGTSVTMYRMGGSCGVCGHNYEYADDGKSSFWKFARDREVFGRLEALGIDDVAIQGEFCGAGIQGNPLRLVTPNWFVFTVVDTKTRRRYGLERTRELCERAGLSMVPVEETGEAFAYSSVEELLERAKGSYPNGGRKEGIVIRPLEPVYSPAIQGALSMKVINNDYLLKKG